MGLFAFGLLTAAAPLDAMVSASTQPAGFVRTTIAGGTGTRQATSLIASPLLQPPVYTGRVQRARAASGATEIANQTVSGISLSALDPSRPHAVFVTSGTFAGFVFRVIEGSSRAITVESHGLDLSNILTEGDTFDVRPLHTFKTLFGSDAASVPFQAAPDAGRADQLLVLRDGTWHAYWFTGSTWRRAGSSADAGDDVILPQDGIVVQRRAPGTTQVRFIGDAPTTDAVISVPAGEVSMVANPFPVVVGLDELGLETVSGWRCASRADLADQVQICVNGAWQTFWHDGARWTNSRGTLDCVAIPAGSAMIVVRQADPSTNPYALVSRPYEL